MLDARRGVRGLWCLLSGDAPAGRDGLDEWPGARRGVRVPADRHAPTVEPAGRGEEAHVVGAAGRRVRRNGCRRRGPAPAGRRRVQQEPGGAARRVGILAGDLAHRAGARDVLPELLDERADPDALAAPGRGCRPGAGPPTASTSRPTGSAPRGPCRRRWSGRYRRRHTSPGRGTTPRPAATSLLVLASDTCGASMAVHCPPESVSMRPATVEGPVT